MRRFIAGAFVLSIVIVAAHLPSRWEPDSHDTHKDIPLRPLTAREAATLLNHARARVVRLDDEKLVLRTAAYVLPNGQIQSATWEDHHNVHRMDRSAVERALGRRLSAKDIDRSFLADSRISFSPTLVPAYFCIEVAFLTLLATVLFVIVRRVRPLLLIPPLFLLTGVASWIFVVRYSPAFVDADFFYQRIAIEELIGGRGPLGLFRFFVEASAKLTMICLPLYVVRLITVRRLRLAAGVLAVAALATQLAIEHHRYRAARARAAATFAKLDFRRLERIQRDCRTFSLPARPGTSSAS